MVTPPLSAEVSTDLKSEILTLTIADLARGGAGVARDESGRVIFVPLTAPGDRVKVQIVEEKKHYAQAVMLELLESSPMRQQPKCPAFGRCGGCQWQHIPYEFQWKTKLGGVQHALSRVQVQSLDPNWVQCPARQIWNYRNRIQLRGFQSELGFYAAASKDLVAIDGCPISRQEINARWEEFRAEGAKRPRPYKLEVEVLENGEIRKTWNAPHAAGGFRQVHDEQNMELQRVVASFLTPGRELLDLYGGRGNLSLRLVQFMKSIHCVDVTSPRVAPEGTPSNYRFHRSSVLPWLMKRKKALAGRPSEGDAERVSVILDPPRAGLANDLSEIAKSLDALGVDEAVAVGCDADAWARDVSRFARFGWRVERVAVVDLFPQTAHVEAVACLRTSRFR